MTTVLKLGGSVITRKDRRETLDRAALSRAADAIADAHASAEPGASADLVVLHGGGSFGHPAASEYAISPTEGSRDATAVREVHAAMGRLNAAVLDAFEERDVPALPVRPLSAAHRDDDGDLALPTGQVATMLDEGFVPVLHGDVVAHAGRGATVASGDELVVALAAGLDAERVGLCSAVPGVLDADGAVVPRVEAFADVASALGGSDATDVTGGMAAKVRALLTVDAPARVFDLDGLAAFLEGGSPGTRIG